VAKNKGFSDHNPSSDRYPTTVLPAGDSLDANNANHSATDRLAVGETTRLSRINIVDELVNDLQSSDPTKRRKAIWELGQRGDSQAVQPLVNLMVDSDSQQRSLILTALSEIGTRTLKPMNRALAMSLQDQSPDVRKNAIRDLTRIYDLITQISQLLHYAVDDADTEVQETAQWALGQLNRIRSTSGLDNLPALHNSSNSPGSLSEEGAP
jgi:HEAT repeat protein